MIDPNERENPPEEELEDVVVPEGEADPAAPKTVDLDEEDAADAQFAKLDNKAFAAMRKEAADAKRERDEFKRKVQEYEARPAPQQAPVYAPAPNAQREHIGGIPVPQNKAEWDALARQDWQVAVEMKSVLKSREEYAKYKAGERYGVQMEESKHKALEKHPELNDPQSPKSQIFLEVLAKNPQYYQDPRGPIHAMRDMEDEMEARGFTRDQIFESKKVAAQAETTRVNRAALTGGGRMPERQGRTVQLSKDDMEFCKSQGLDPKEYAREKLNLENNRRGAQL